MAKRAPVDAETRHNLDGNIARIREALEDFRFRMKRHYPEHEAEFSKLEKQFARFAAHYESKADGAASAKIFTDQAKRRTV